jgi:hypothetical protein
LVFHLLAIGFGLARVTVACCHKERNKSKEIPVQNQLVGFPIWFGKHDKHVSNKAE